jgi:TonB family protein
MSINCGVARPMKPRFSKKRTTLILLATGLIVGSFFGVNLLPAQVKPTEIDDLARQLTGKLSVADKKGVLVIDLETPDHQWLSFGEWLADQLSASLANQGQPVEVIDRKQLYAALKDQLSPGDEFQLTNANTLGKQTGANTIIIGSYGPVDEDLGVTLSAYRVSESTAVPSTNYMIGVVNGKILLTPQIRSHLNVSLDSLRPKDGIYRAGMGGVTIPACVRCPFPSMHVPDVDVPGLVRDKRNGGEVVLQLVVTADGSVTQVDIPHPLGYGVDEQYKKAASGWEFTPAVDANNKPVPVHVSMSVRFNFK